MDYHCPVASGLCTIIITLCAKELFYTYSVLYVTCVTIRLYHVRIRASARYMEERREHSSYWRAGIRKRHTSRKAFSALHLTHISSGDLFRKAMSERTREGLQAKAYLDRGTWC